MPSRKRRPEPAFSGFFGIREVGLYELEESWFGGVSARPLVLGAPRLSWDRIQVRSPWFDSRDFVAQFVLFPRLTHRFPRAGQYQVSVNPFLGRGGEQYGYQLRIVSAKEVRDEEGATFGEPAHPDPSDWLERDSSTLRQIGSFQRGLSSRRLEELLARSVPSHPPVRPRPAAHGSGRGFKEDGSGVSPLQKPGLGDSPSPLGEVSVPGWAVGVIEQPGDVDRYRFRVEAGQRLAFEIETPRASPPHFNPRLQGLDGEGREVVTNIYREYGGNGLDANRCLERKTLHTFAQGGDYTLQIHDLTTQLGSPEFAYRILIRPQIPHLGRTEVTLGVASVSSQLIEVADHLNLSPGEVARLTVLCEQEEGFDGDVLVEVENLPPGVQVFAGTPAPWTELLLQGIGYRPPGGRLMEPDSHRPDRQAVTLLLFAGPEAAPSVQPRFLHLQVRPVVSGKVGARIPAGRMPFMVVAPRDRGAGGSGQDRASFR